MIAMAVYNLSEHIVASEIEAIVQFACFRRQRESTSHKPQDSPLSAKDGHMLSSDDAAN